MRKSYLSVFAFLLALAAPLAAQTHGTVTFSGLKDLEFIDSYYNGGTGSLGSGPGKNYQLEFSTNAQSIVSAAKNGSGNFINNPGNSPVMFFGTGTSVTINATAGVSTAIWFSYSALQAGNVTIYDSTNGTGNVLANIALTLNNSGCDTYKLCVWSPVGVPLSTAAKSIRFTGAANLLGIGAIHLGVKIPTFVDLTSSSNPSVQGEPVTFTAAVSATGATPIGSVTFKNGNKMLGTVTVTGGIAALTVSDLPVGSSNIRATFSGPGFATRSASVTQTVN